MNDYSDLLFLIGAIAIYALLVTNTNRAMLQSNQMLTTTEMDYGAVSVAQNIIEKARWMKYEDVTNSNVKKLKSAKNSDDYKVNVVISDTTLSGSNKNNRIITIEVTNKLGQSNNESSMVTMTYIKTDRN